MAESHRERIVTTTAPHTHRTETSVQRSQASPAATQRRMELSEERMLLKVSQFIWLSFGVLEGLIGIRLLLKMIAANPNNAFASLIYSVTEPFLAPFMSLARSPEANGVVLEVPSVVALLVYILLSVLIERLIRIIFSRPRAAG